MAVVSSKLTNSMSCSRLVFASFCVMSHPATVTRFPTYLDRSFAATTFRRRRRSL